MRHCFLVTLILPEIKTQEYGPKVYFLQLPGRSQARCLMDMLLVLGEQFRPGFHICFRKDRRDVFLDGWQADE